MKYNLKTGGRSYATQSLRQMEVPWITKSSCHLFHKKKLRCVFFPALLGGESSLTQNFGGRTALCTSWIRECPETSARALCESLIMAIECARASWSERWTFGGNLGCPGLMWKITSKKKSWKAGDSCCVFFEQKICWSFCRSSTSPEENTTSEDLLSSMTMVQWKMAVMER